MRIFREREQAVRYFVVVMNPFERVYQTLGVQYHRAEENTKRKFSTRGRKKQLGNLAFYSNIPRNSCIIMYNYTILLVNFFDRTFSCLYTTNSFTSIEA